MELWIRSQDKEKLMKINNIEIQHYYSYKDAQEKFLLPSGSFEYRKVSKKDKYIESVIMCNDEICLGKYNSKERALEVLDEIQNILNPKVLVNTYKVEQAQLCDGTQFIKPMLDDVQVQNVTSYVYEMPKD